MAKLFGEFLVDHHIISEEQLAEALVAQVSMVPSTVEVIYKNKLLPDRKIIEILKCNQTTGRDFRSAARFLGIWSKDLEIAINRYLEESRKPLGEVLVELNILSQTSISQALDQYVLNSNYMDRDAYESIVLQFGREIIEELTPFCRHLMREIQRNTESSDTLIHINNSIRKATIIASPIRNDQIQLFLRDLNLTFNHITNNFKKIDSTSITNYLQACIHMFQSIPPMLAIRSQDVARNQFMESLKEVQVAQSKINPVHEKTVA